MAKNTDTAQTSTEDFEGRIAALENNVRELNYALNDLIDYLRATRPPVCPPVCRRDKAVQSGTSLEDNVRELNYALNDLVDYLRGVNPPTCPPVCGREPTGY